MDKNQIQKQAKQILDKFASALSNVETSEDNSFVDRDAFERVEGEGNKCEEGFKQNMLENAPESDNDFVIVEKGDWK